MRDIKSILEGIVSQAKPVGSGGSAFRHSSSSGAKGPEHGIDVGAHRNQAHEVRAKEATLDNAKKREQEVEKRNREAEQRRKETMNMAKEETVTEAKKFVFDKPHPAMVKAYDKRDTSELHGMHKRWSSDHSSPKNNPDTSEKLLAVHHVLKSRGENVGELPKHKNLGLTMHEDINLDEAIKGWKNAGRDLMKRRSDAYNAKQSAVLVSLKKDGNESKMHDAKSYHASEEDARKKHADIAKLNPNRKIKHNLYVDGKKVDTLGEETNTEKRMKIKNVARPDDAAPTSEKSTLAKTGEIKTKIVEDKPTMSMPNFGLSASLINAARQIVEKKHEDDGADAKKMTGGKTAVKLEPETNDKMEDSDNKPVKKKSHTVPKTDKEKKLAALASPKDKITHKDVLVGRGVVKEEEEQLDELKKSTLGSYVKKAGAERGHLGMDLSHMTNSKKTILRKMKNRQTGINKAVDKLAKEDVDFSVEELARLEEIARTFTAEQYERDIYEASTKSVPSATTAVSSPIRGANQDQSGIGTKSSSTDYTISDSKKMKVKEEVELDESFVVYHKDSKNVVSTHVNHATAKKHAEKKGSDYSVASKSHWHANINPKRSTTNEETNLDEARGRPRKNPLPAGQEAEVDDTHKHPMQQLEKIAHAIAGNEPHFEHKDGSKTKVGKNLARHMVVTHNSMKTTQEKNNFADKLHANRDSMRSEMGKHF